MNLDGAWAQAWIRSGALVLAEHRALLNTLDREIGDGDHGENMDRGFQAVLPKLEDLPNEATPGDVLKLVATTLISTVGGAAGPLYGTAFLKAAAAVSGAPRLDGAAVLALLTAARDGIVLRGKAEPGPPAGGLAPPDGGPCASARHPRATSRERHVPPPPPRERATIGQHALIT